MFKNYLKYRLFQNTLVILTILFNLNCSKKNDTNQITPTPFTEILNKWNKVKAPEQGIIDISFKDNLNGYYALYPGGLSKTTDGGKNWKPVLRDKNTGSDIFNLYINNDELLFVVSNKLLTIIKNDSITNNSNLVILNRPRDISYYTTYRFMDVFFSSDKNGFLTINDLQQSLINYFKLLRTKDNGMTWSEDLIFKKSIDKFNTEKAAGYSAIYFNNKNNGWVGLQNNIAICTHEDSSWTLSKSQFYNITSIYGISKNVVFAADTTNLYVSTNGGIDFNRIQLNIPKQNVGFSDLEFIDDKIGYFSIGSFILKTEDGGNSWKTEVQLNPDEKIIEIDFVDKNHGWAITSKGFLLVLNE